MSDHEFEQQVQYRMEQLKLRPSEAVWANVEKNIRKDKRRRRMILWLPIALLMLGFGGWLMLKQDQQPNGHALSNTTNNTPSSQNTVPSSDNSTPDQSATIQPDNTPSSGNTTSGQPSETGHNTSDKKPATDETVVKENAVTTNTAKPSGNEVTAGKVTTSKSSIPVIVKKDQITTDKHRSPRRAGITVKKTSTLAENSRPKRDPARKRAGKSDNSVAGNKPQPAAGNTSLTIDRNNDNNTNNNKDIADQDNKPVQANDITAAGNDNNEDSALTVQPIVAAQPKAKDTASAVTPPASLAAQPKKKKQSPASKWQWGVSAVAGYSGITKDGLFGFLENKTKVADVTQAVNSAPQSNTFAPQFPRPVYTTPTITMGTMYSVGGFVQRTMTSHIKLSAGLQYSYQSARTVVGNKVNNSRMVNQSAYQAAMVNYYYDANNTEDYTNKYHFIELPVTFHLQLNKGKYLPLGWDFGIAANYMIATTALHYDGQNGVYYKDNSFFNKMQWSAATGFNFGLFPQSKHPVFIGPMLKYNMTGLLKKEHYTGQHLWSVGLRASVLLKK